MSKDLAIKMSIAQLVQFRCSSFLAVKIIHCIRLKALNDRVDILVNNCDHSL